MNLPHLPTSANFHQDIILHIQEVHQWRVRLMHSLINYIKEVYETIVTRDLVQKYALPDTLVLQRLSEFLMDNISNLTSPNKVSQLLTANEIPTNHVTVGKYLLSLIAAINLPNSTCIGCF